MSDPEFVLGPNDDLAGAVDVLRSGGFVLLPSDTAYSVAALPLSGAVRTRINTLLRRRDMPVSLAFPDIAVADRWIAANPVARRLLRRFCPGPVTVVCTAAPGLPDQLFEQAVASRNRTVGVRVPDSAPERRVAAATEYPVTTVAVIGPDGRIATSLAEAITIIQHGLAEAGFQRWCAIDGKVTGGNLSTVIEVVGDQVELIRLGAIPFKHLQEVAAGHE
ncbi:MAG: L-threonylcarbamoyladenylate synthase [Labedaea sp.]